MFVQKKRGKLSVKYYCLLTVPVEGRGIDILQFLQLHRYDPNDFLALISLWSYSAEEGRRMGTTTTKNPRKTLMNR